MRQNVVGLESSRLELYTRAVYVLEYECMPSQANGILVDVDIGTSSCVTDIAPIPPINTPLRGYYAGSAVTVLSSSRAPGIDRHTRFNTVVIHIFDVKQKRKQKTKQNKNKIK